jgi:hypothetical protein
MRGPLFNFTAIVLLALLAATIALWVRSYWRDDSLYLDWRMESIGVNSAGGVITFWRLHGRSHRKKLGWESREPEEYYLVEHRFGQFGFGREPTNDPKETGYNLMVPHWSLLLPLSALLLFRVVLLLRSSRSPSRSACEKCGYNLTGNTSGICPECGTAIPLPDKPSSPGEAAEGRKC